MTRGSKLFVVSSALVVAATVLIGLDVADKIASVVGGTASVAALLLAFVSYRESQHAPLPVSGAEDELAAHLRRRWSRELRIRGLRRPEPIAVAWASTRLPVQADLAGTPERGDVAGLAATWRAMTCRQLIVLGEPGAGKTSLAVLLVAGLLADRRPADPVPFLVNLSGWHPGREDLDAWLAGRLTEQFPAPC